MIIGEVEKISNTNILVSKLVNKVNKKNYQLTIYSNKVETNNPVAMILPFANGEFDPVIIETNKYDNRIYRSIDINCFEKKKKSYGMLSKYVDSSCNLKVFRSGNYRYSIAKNTGDISRLDNGVFKIKSELKTLLGDYSNKKFGFIVCIIDANVDYTPFAYISDLIDNQFFIPTKHYHEHKSTNVPSLMDYTSGYPLIKKSSGAGDWDHSIYIIGAKDGLKGDNDYTFAHTDLNLDDTYSFSRYLCDSISCKKENLLRIKKEGFYENKDFVVPCM